MVKWTLSSNDLFLLNCWTHLWNLPTNWHVVALWDYLFCDILQIIVITIFYNKIYIYIITSRVISAIIITVIYLVVGYYEMLLPVGHFFSKRCDWPHV